MVTSQTESGPEPTARSCGACSVCCTVMHVTPIDKPAGARCPHQSEAGCDIYDSRPGVCRAWHCMWVRDDGRVFREHERPDKVGVFFTASKPDPESGEQTIYAHQAHPGAADSEPGRAVIERLSAMVPIKVLASPQASPGVTPLTHNGQTIDRAA